MSMKLRVSCAIIATLVSSLALLPTVPLDRVRAQTVEPCTPAGTGAPCGSGGSGGVARADFNHDGYADLAIGAAFENVGDIVNAGAVYIIYGSPTGLAAPPTSGPTPKAQRWSQGSSGVPGAVEADDNFGMALTAADFNDDDIVDLAIGAPGEDVDGVDGAGAVIVLFGSAEGLKATGSGSTTPKIFTLLDWRQPSCGNAILLGSSGCSLFQNDLAIPRNAHFGASLAWGDFDADSHADLAIGAPGTGISRQIQANPIATFIDHAGLVTVLFGSSFGLHVNDWRFFYQPIPGSPFDSGDTLAEANDNFGSSLAAGDFDGNGHSELVVGVPYEDLGSTAGAGAIQIYDNCSSSNLTFCSRFISQATSGVDGSPEASDLFGFSLAVGDFDGNRRDDLAVGVPYENVGSLSNAGVVHIFHGSSSGLSVTNSQMWSQSDIWGSSPSVFDGSPSQANDYFGFSLAAGDFDGDLKADLAIGVPYEDVVTNRTGTFKSIVDAGEVDVLYGSPTGLSKTGRAPQFWHQDTINVEGNVEENDHFGFSLAVANFGGANTLDDLAIGVPLEDVDTNGDKVSNAGAVAVLYSSLSGHGLTSSGDQLWHQDIANVPGVCQGGGMFGYTVH